MNGTVVAVDAPHTREIIFFASLEKATEKRRKSIEFIEYIAPRCLALNRQHSVAQHTGRPIVDSWIIVFVIKIYKFTWHIVKSCCRIRYYYVSERRNGPLILLMAAAAVSTAWCWWIHILFCFQFNRPLNSARHRHRLPFELTTEYSLKINFL